ncbi:hypothetical protein HDU85_002530 [Gaertneriomyces sp. JEL0708]|nr:hypothetical protein HDU85_002530 [Gaertneriomyces sp. JEL0708]
MGVTCLIYLPSAATSALDRIAYYLNDQLDLKEKDERWRVSCRSYRDEVAQRLRGAPGDTVAHSYTPKAMYVLRLGHYSRLMSMVATVTERRGGAAAFPVDAGQNAGETGVVVEVEREFDAIIAKLKNLWSKSQEVSLEGRCFGRPDLVVRTGTLRVSNDPVPGIIIQAEEISGEQHPSAVFSHLGGLLRRILSAIPTVNPVELSNALHIQAPVIPDRGNPQPFEYADWPAEDPSSGNVPSPEPVIHDWHEYAAVRLKEGHFTKSHEAYQFFRLFRQAGLL